jgi:hypothetical protein
MNWKSAKNIEDNKYDIPGDWLKIEYFEVLNILFRVENALRVFVYVILKNEFQDKWKDLSITSDDEEASTIGAIAKKRISQDRNYAYLGYMLNSPLLHLTSGELIRIIISENYWKFFKPYFLASKDIIKNKLDEIGNVRNSVAHFRPIKKGDVELIKQNGIHTLSELEKNLVDLISCPDVVPTNTDEPWYKELSLLKSEECRFGFYQSKREEWTQIILHFDAPTTGLYVSDNWGKFQTFNLKTNGLLNNFKNLIKHVICVTESNPSIFTEDTSKINIIKQIRFTLSAKSLQTNHKIIKEELEDILSQISKEVTLIQQDNLARGKLIETFTCYLNKPEESKYYRSSSDPFTTSLGENSPVEFWGTLEHASDNFITNTNRFPWMPDTISEDNDSLPF